MTLGKVKSHFIAKLLSPAKADDTSWAFIVLPKEVSDTLPRRGRTSVEGTINGHDFQATLEPDGKLSHWLKISMALQETVGAEVGDIITLALMPMKEEPEPDIPADFKAALTGDPKAYKVWNDTTSIARLDWIHWLASAKQHKTRLKRIADACNMLASGKKRVCCFDPSGYYSKAFSAPEAASKQADSDTNLG